MKSIVQLLTAISILTPSLATAGPEEANDRSAAAGGSSNSPAPAEEPPLKLAELGQCPTQPKVACRSEDCLGYGRLIHKCVNPNPVHLGSQINVVNDDANPYYQDETPPRAVILAGCPCCTDVDETLCHNLDCQALPPETTVCRDGSELAGCPCTTEEKMEERMSEPHSPRFWVDEDGEWIDGTITSGCHFQRGTASAAEATVGLLQPAHQYVLGYGCT